MKYNKLNGITPMKTHVDSTHFGLIAKRNLKLIEKFVAKDFEANHIRENWKKRSGPSGPKITYFFVATNPYKHNDETQQRFLENLVMYICKTYQPFSHNTKMWHL
jgi:hypothetical protein